MSVLSLRSGFLERLDEALMQRLLDILFSVLALVVLSPLLLPISLVLRFTGEREVFYTQTRIGHGGKPFGILKFATMLRDSPNIGAGEITLVNDPRILPFGQFLRKTKLNELPQLLNVLRGDLSLVGPRPMVPNTFAEYPADAREGIESVLPGLTGVGSIIFRDEERFLAGRDNPHAFYREVIIPYKAALEQWYVRRRNLRTYLEVIGLTAWVVLFPNSQMPRRVWPSLPEAPKELG